MDLSKHGFDMKVQNVKSLERIYDLLEGKWKLYNIGYECYFVYDDNAITEEITLLQSKLAKKFWQYRNYTWKRQPKKCCSITEINKVIDEYNTKLEKQKEIQAKREKKQQKKANADRGIYGIYCDDQLVYIGKTDVDFKTRFSHHKDCIINKKPEQYLHRYLIMMKENHPDVKITLKPLVNIKDLNTDGKIGNREIEAMELALITIHQPCCNIEGIKKPYKFTYR
jgi:hypothetical protein